MYAYYFSLAWRNFRKRPSYVLLIMLILGVGIGLFMTAYSLLYILNGDPIPQKSERLLNIRMGGLLEDSEPVEMMSSAQLSILRSAIPEIPLLATTYGFASVESDRGDRREAELLRFANAGFFEMFNVPMRQGRGWTSEEDIEGSAVTVISRKLAVSLFGTEAVIGRSIAIGGADFRVIGIIDDWLPTPRFYDLSVGAYAPADQAYFPLRSVNVMDDDVFMTRQCPIGQADISPRGLESSKCSWLNV